MNDHYKQSKYQAIDVIADRDLNFNLGNVVKYIQRAKHKGTEYQDLVKAMDYLQHEIKKHENSAD